MTTSWQFIYLDIIYFLSPFMYVYPDTFTCIHLLPLILVITDHLSSLFIFMRGYIVSNQYITVHLWFFKFIFFIISVPLEILTLYFELPFMLFFTDIRQGIFYASLLSFWLVFSGEHLMVSQASFGNKK